MNRRKTYNKQNDKMRKSNPTNNFNNKSDEKLTELNDNFVGIINNFQNIERILTSKCFEMNKLNDFKTSFNNYINMINNFSQTIFEYLNKKNMCNILLNNPKEIEQKNSPNITSYKAPAKEINESDGINMSLFSQKFNKVVEEIKKYRNYFEDTEKNIQRRNEYLEYITCIAYKAHEFSFILVDTLLKEFNKTMEFNTIIYEKAKEKFSSWVNQIIIKNSSNFFDSNCSRKFGTFQFNTALYSSFFDNFKKVFINLSEVFTEAMIYSEKNIEIEYINKGIKYEGGKMTDITDLDRTRYVNFTVIPGLCVEHEPIPNGAPLVFCEYKLNFQYKFNFDIAIPKTQELVLSNTIKTKDLKDKLIIKIEHKIENYKGNRKYTFIIKTEPKIPEEDKPLFLFFIYKYSNGKYANYITKSGKEKEFHIFDQQIESGKNLLLFHVKLGGEIIKSNQLTINF